MANADLERTIKILFDADNARVINAINGTVDKFGNLDKTARDLAAPFAAAGDMVLKIDAALAAMAIGGLALSIREAGKFGDSFNEISTLVDGAGGDMDRYRQELLDYGSGASFAMEQINASVYAAISAGLDYRDSLGFIAVAEKLAIAGKGDLQATTVALASTLNAYGEEADQAARYSDILFQTVRSGQTTLPELSASLAQVTSIAAAAGIPFETVAAAIADLTAKGMPTAQAMTSIKGAIQAIIKPTEDAQKAAAELGIDFSYTALQSKGFEGVLLDVYRATGGNVEQIARLFSNVEGLKGELALFGQDGGAGFLATLQKMRDSSGVTAAAYEKMADNFELVNQRLANSLRYVAIEVGDQLQATYGDTADGLGELLRAIGKEVDKGTFDPFFDLLNELGLNVATFIKDLAKTLPEAMKQVDFSQLLAAFRELGGSVGEFFSDFDPQKPEDVAKAIQFVVDSLETLTVITKGMVDVFRPVLDSFIVWTQGINDTDKATKESAGNIMAQAKIIAEGGLVLVGMLGLMGENAAAMGAIFTTVFNGIGIAFNTLKESFHGLMLIFSTNLEMLFTKLEGVTFGSWRAEMKLNKEAAAAWTDDLIADITKLQKENQEKANQIGEAWAKVGDDTQTAAGKAAGLGKSLADLPAETEVGVTLREIEQTQQLLTSLGFDLAAIPHETLIKLAAAKDDASFEAVFMSLEAIPGEITTTVSAEADQEAIERTAAVMGMNLPSRREVIVETTIDPVTGQEVISFFRNPDNIPPSKQVDVLAQVDDTRTKNEMEKIKVAADLVKEAIQWKAKLEIAQVEANAKKVEAIMNSVGKSADGAAQAVSAIFSNVGALKSAGIWTSQIEKYIDRELKIQEEAVKIQRDMADAEIKMVDARTKRLNAGGALITVSGDGLAPHLEAMMFSVLEAVQVRGNLSQDDFLLGLPAR